MCKAAMLVLDKFLKDHGIDAAIVAQLHDEVILGSRG